MLQTISVRGINHSIWQQFQRAARTRHSIRQRGVVLNVSDVLNPLMLAFIRDSQMRLPELTEKELRGADIGDLDAASEAVTTRPHQVTTGEP